MDLYWRTGKVLVVDDEETVRNLVQRILKEAGYDVVTAASGEEALNTAQRQDIGVVFLDIKMPGMSGMEVLQKLTTRWPNTCVVMATAVADTETAVEAMKLGAYDYITKPFSSDDLILRVRRAVEKRNLKQQSEQYRISLEKRVQEQTAQLQEQFTALVDTLMREHNLLARLSGEQSKDAKPLFSGLPPEFQKPMTSAEEYRDALLRILKRGGTK